jgi:dipeptidase D
MDSEALGMITCGCAGGIRSDLTLKCAPEAFSGNALRVAVSGLMGGHSGENINDGRANANKLMGRLLASVPQEQDVRIVSISGGSKDNAIPRECEVLLAVSDVDAVEAALTETAEQIASELVPEDRGFSMVCESAEDEAVMLSRADTDRVIAILACAANGVLAMSHAAEGMVEFSRNLGVIRTEGDEITFVFSSRSAIEGQIDASTRELDALARLTGCATRHYSRYPGWNFAPTSALRDAYRNAYAAVTGKTAGVNVIHAGLECGIIYSKKPGMDIISIGPDMQDIHSPKEKLDLSSVEVFWQTLAELIARWK